MGTSPPLGAIQPRKNRDWCMAISWRPWSAAVLIILSSLWNLGSSLSTTFPQGTRDTEKVGEGNLHLLFVCPQWTVQPRSPWEDGTMHPSTFFFTSIITHMLLWFPHIHSLKDKLSGRYWCPYYSQLLKILCWNQVVWGVSLLLHSLALQLWASDHSNQLEDLTSHC